MNRPSLPRVAVLTTVGLLVIINVLGLPLRTDVAPLGIVSLQLATSVEHAGAILASWVDVPTARILGAHGLDVLLPVAYAVAIGSVASRLGAGRAAIAAVIAAVADQVENAAMAATIVSAPTAVVVRITLVAAVVKWTTLAVALVLLGRASVSVRRRAAVT